MENKEKKKEFSDEQRSAIDTRDRTVLVSAAAGSGKTTTLTERIIRQLLDEKNPQSIGDMLIVTFTNASVYDLRKKIGEALTEASLLAPENKNLESQLRLLDYARIMTIDSFCAEVVRTHAERLGISPAYRICETAETLILERTMIDTLIDSALKGELSERIDPVKFEKLCDALTGVKNTADLADILITLYEKTKNLVKGVGIFKEFANNYLHYSTIDLDKTPYAKYILEKACATAEYFSGGAARFAARLSESENDQLRALGGHFYEVADIVKRLNDPTLNYLEMREALANIKYPKATSVSKPKPQLAESASSFKDDKLKPALKKLYADYFAYDCEEWKQLFIESADYVSVLAEFLDLFSTLFFEEKRRRAALEFSDVERLAYNSFYNSDGTLTEIALEYRDMFSAIYIDEYQDVNELQNMIFSAVSKPDVKFMVGDIKQSIYGFRGARPEIFAQMKSAFPPLEAGYNVESTIFMSNNYRCDKGIIDFVNKVFDSLFTAVKKSVGYVDADKLQYKKRYEGFVPEYEKCKICLIDNGDEDEDEEDDSVSDEQWLSDREQNDLDAALREAEFVAEKIESLIKKGARRDGKSIKAGDIAIIMRRKNNFSLFEAALKRRGISATAPERSDFFLNKEILLALALLSAIDNPRKDIPLAALMCSPLYSFTADELYLIKKSGNKTTLYDSLLSYLESNGEDKKAKGFVEKLNHYRTLCEGMGVDTLISRLYAETGLLSLASKNGGKENLYKLLSYAKSFEGSTYKGLYNFITYVNNLIEQNAKIDKNDNAGNDENTVSIGTIHSSKGLEFPVVFVCECGSKLINLDLRQKVAFDESFGISFLMRGPGGLALVENPLKKTINDYMDAKFYEEIVRLLYVALTRAKEKLFVTATVTDPKGYLLTAREEAAPLTAHSLRLKKTYMDMIVGSGADAEMIFSSDADEEEEETAEKLPPPTKESADQESADGKKELCDQLIKRFTYVYPNEHLTVMPEKMSVSRLSPRLLDGADEETEILFDEEKKRERREPTPKFIAEDPLDKSAKRGIATHNFLQFFDLKRLVENGADAELKRLTDSGFISEKNAALVRKNELYLFERSELLCAMSGAKKLYREFRFNTRLPAEYFAEGDAAREKYKGNFVLVQGVIDCLIENPDGSFRLIDYKTDRLTKEELSDESLATETLNKKHAQQLSYYALAVERIFGKKPEKIEVYSMPLGKTVKIDPTI